MPIPLARLSPNNQRWLDYTGQPLSETQGFGWLEAIHPDERPASRAAFVAAFATGQSLEMEHRIRRHDGMYRWFLMRQQPLRNAAGQFTQWFGAADIHEQRIKREELTEQVVLATAQLRALSQQLLHVQEEERRHLARELHDEISQALTGLQLQLATVRYHETIGEAPTLVQAEALVRDLVIRVSALSMELRPSILDNLGLLPTLLWYAERYQARTGIQVDLRHHNLDQRFSPLVEITAYRLVQEALTNVARHAQTDMATIQLLAEGGILLLTIRDTGLGFDLGATQTSGGMGGMRERIALVGGTMEIETAPGHGALITAEIPYVDTIGGSKEVES